MSKIDPRVLKEFATTERHHEVLDAVIELGSANKASKKLKCGRRTIDVMLRRLEKYAASQGVAPTQGFNPPDRRRVRSKENIYRL